MIKIRVDSRLRLQLASLPAGVAEELKAACTHRNPEHAKLRAMGYAAGKEQPLIRTWRKQRGELLLPRGATAVVRQVFGAAGLEIEWVDARSSGSAVRRLYVHPVKLWAHQKRMVRAVLDTENCLVRAPTGSGKTTGTIALMSLVSLNALVVVWTGNLLDQWAERLHSELGLPYSEIGLVRGSRVSFKPITLAMQQTLMRSPPKLKAACEWAGLVVADEVQRFAARTFLDVIDHFPARYRVGISADETRKDGKEFLIYSQFGEVACDIKQAELVEAGIVHDVEVRVVPTEFRADWYLEQGVSNDETPDFNRLLEEMTTNKKRNELLMWLVDNECKRGSRVLVLTHRRAHAQLVQSMLVGAGSTCGMMMGGDEWADEFARSKRAMVDGTLLAAAGTYQAIGQGLDVPVVDRGIAATPIANNRQFFGQVRGRICRTAEGKRDAVLYYLWDRYVFGREMLVKLLRWNKRVTVMTDAGWQPAQQFMEATWQKKK